MKKVVGKLTKVIVPVHGAAGAAGKDGAAGIDGRDAPTMEEIMVNVNAGITSMYEETIAKMPMGMLDGSGHRGGAGFHVGDLPGFKDASANMYFGTNDEGLLGFWENGNAELYIQETQPTTTEDYLWVQTGLGEDGEDFTFFIQEDC